MKALILAPRRTPTPSNVELLWALRKRGVDAKYVDVRGVSFTLVSEQDLVIIRGIPPHLPYFEALTLAEEIDSRTLSVNPAKKVLLCRNKWLVYKTLKKLMPKSFIVHGWKDVTFALEKITEGIAKPINESLGRGVTIINSLNARIVFNTLPKPFIIQEKLDKVRDVRAFVIGDEVIGAIYRIPSPGSLITNVHVGSEVDPALKENYEREALEANRTLGLYYSGVDLVEDVPNNKVIEVNASPLWKGLMVALNIDVASLLADFFINLAKK